MPGMTATVSVIVRRARERRCASPPPALRFRPEGYEERGSAPPRTRRRAALRRRASPAGGAAPGRRRGPTAASAGEGRRRGPRSPAAGATAPAAGGAAPSRAVDGPSRPGPRSSCLAGPDGKPKPTRSAWASPTGGSSRCSSGLDEGAQVVTGGRRGRPRAARAAPSPGGSTNPFRRAGPSRGTLRPTMADAPLIRVEDLRKSYCVGDVTVHALRGVDLAIERGILRRGGGRLRQRQVDVHEHPRPPRPADLGPLLARRRGRLGLRPRPPRDPAQPHDRLRLPELQPAAPHLRPRERGAAAALQRQAPADRGAPPTGPGAPRARSGSAAASTTPRPALGRPAAARGHRARARQRARAGPRRRAHRATWTAAPASRSWRSCSG